MRMHGFSMFGMLATIAVLGVTIGHLAHRYL